jgi:polyisoprenoid-binding protein YceI
LVAVGLAAVAFVWFAGGDPGAPTGLTAAPLEGPGTLYTIVPGQSTAAFEIDEELRGQPNHVVGTTGDVAGNIRVDTADAAVSSIGTVVVAATTFATDSSFRDRAIRGPVILNSADEQFQFITFEPSSISGLSGSITEDREVAFQVAGDLTVKGTTAPVTFDVTASITGGNLVGTAVATISRADFDIGIPSVPSVANVSDEVLIRLQFVAAPG